MESAESIRLVGFAESRIYPPRIYIRGKIELLLGKGAFLKRMKEVFHLHFINSQTDTIRRDACDLITLQVSVRKLNIR